MSGVLARIVAQKQHEVAELRRQGPPRSLRAAPPRSLRAALHRPAGAPLRLLAEHKRQSPSAGPLSTVLEPSARAAAYVEAGAVAISVLTDAAFFGGSYAHLAEIHAALHAAATPVPLLAKEFVLDPIQIAHAAAHGADAVLLIVRLLEQPKLIELLEACKMHSLDALVEVVDAGESARALEAGATLVGVNARDLDTLQMNLPRAAAVLSSLPPEVIGVHLSGLHRPEQVADVARGPADAALLGEALMREDDPRPLLTRLVRAAAEPAPS